MRTLDEIVASARLNEPLDQDAERLKEWMVAATNSPQECAGEANDPQNPDAVAWYRAMHGVGEPEHPQIELELSGGGPCYCQHDKE